MEDYSFDSPSKKFARFMFWSDSMVDHHDHFQHGKFLVRASMDGGDVRVLTGLNIDPRQIIAVGSDPVAALATQERFPKVKVAVSDSYIITKEFHRKLLMAYLDLGEGITDNMVRSMGRVIQHGLVNEAMVGVSFVVGKEEGESLIEDIGVMEKELVEGKRHDFMDDVSYLKMHLELESKGLHKTGSRTDRKQNRTGAVATLQKVLSDPEKYKDNIAPLADAYRKLHVLVPDIELKVMSRVSALGDMLSELLFPIRTMAIAKAAFVYQEDGVTRGIANFRTRRWPPKTPEKKFLVQAMEWATEQGYTRIQDCTKDETGLMGEVWSWFDHIQREEGAELTPAQENQCAKELMGFFNLKEETVWDWRRLQKLAKEVET